MRLQRSKWIAVGLFLFGGMTVAATHGGAMWRALMPFSVLPLLWCFPSASWVNAPWTARKHIRIGLGMGLLAAVVSCAWMSQYPLTDGQFVATDFSRYCGSLGAMLEGDWTGWHGASSLTSAWILAPIADQIGLMNALAWGAFLSFALTAAACYWWATALHSRLAGVAAVLFTLSMMPLVVMSRTLTFYPLHIACFTLAVSLGTVAMLRRSQGALLAGGIAIGLALLIDVRGLLFALPAFMMVSIGALRAERKKIPRRLGLVLLPIVLSWGVAQRAYLDPTVSLEEQVSNLDSHLLAREALGDQVHKPSSRYVWGHSSLLDIPVTFNELRLQAESVSAFTRELPENKRKIRLFLRPWAWPACLALGLAVWGLGRRPWRQLALVLSLLPAAAALRSVLLIEVNIRFLGAIAPALAVLLGVAFAGLVGLRKEGASQPKGEGAPLAALKIREPLALLLLFALVLGALPSWVSPAARPNDKHRMAQFGRALNIAEETRWSSNETVLQEQFSKVVDHMGQPPSKSLDTCKRRLYKDLQAGHGLNSRLFR